MSIAIEAFYPDLRADVPGCPEPTMRRELLNALDELCTRTWAWWYYLDDFELDKGETEYTLAPPSGSQIVGLVEIKYASGSDFIGYRFRPPYLRLDAEPTASTPLTVCLALKPDRTATSVEDFLFVDWREAACAGAKWRLLTLPDKPWTNLQTATVHKQLFDQAVRDAVRRKNSNATGRSLCVAPRRFS